MAKRVPVLTCPTDEWLTLDVRDPAGAVKAARQIVGRGGWRNRRYARAALPSLVAIWKSCQRGNIGPVAVYVPFERPRMRRLDFPTVTTQWHPPPRGGATMEALIEDLSQPHPHTTRGPENTLVELPAGPALRSYRESVVVLTPDLTAVSAFLSHYLFPENGPRELLALSAAWTPDPAFDALVGMTDQIAGALTLHKRTLERPYGWIAPAAKAEDGPR